MAYPSAADLSAYLDGIGVVISDSAQSLIDRRAKAAAEAFERDAGWRPFLSSGVSQARTFRLDHDPTLPGGWAGFGGLYGGYHLRPDVSTMVDLKAGLLTLESLQVGEVTLVQGTDFRLDSFDDPDGPAQAIHFLRHARFSAHEPIVVTGVWGRFADLPSQVEEAVLAKGALLHLGALPSQDKGSLILQKAGPVEYQYDRSKSKDRLTILGETYAEAVETYRFTGVA